MSQEERSNVNEEPPGDDEDKRSISINTDFSTIPGNKNEGVSQSVQEDVKSQGSRKSSLKGTAEEAPTKSEKHASFSEEPTETVRYSQTQEAIQDRKRRSSSKSVQEEIQAEPKDPAPTSEESTREKRGSELKNVHSKMDISDFKKEAAQDQNKKTSLKNASQEIPIPIPEADTVEKRDSQTQDQRKTSLLERMSLKETKEEPPPKPEKQASQEDTKDQRNSILERSSLKKSSLTPSIKSDKHASITEGLTPEKRDSQTEEDVRSQGSFRASEEPVKPKKHTSTSISESVGSTRKRKESLLSGTGSTKHERHLSIVLPGPPLIPEEKESTLDIEEKEPITSAASKIIYQQSSLEERRLSKAVTEFMKQRKSLTISEITTHFTITPTEVENIEDNSQIITEKPLTEKYTPRRESRYSKAIEGLEKLRKQSLMQRSADEAPDKKIRFVESINERDSISAENRMKLRHRTSSKNCEQYLKTEDFSQLFVEEIIQDAVAKTNVIKKESSTRIIEGIEYYADEEFVESSNMSLSTFIYELEWPDLETFTIEIGTAKIVEYLSYWEFKEDWKYCVNYLKSESDRTCDYHRYEAIFSIPCKQYPIPQATASVYFTIEVSRVKPKECIVEVYYSFEGRRLVQNLGQYKPQEAWLFYIIDAKINFYKRLKF